MNETALAVHTPPTESEYESLRRALYARNRELADAEEALRLEKQKTAGIESGVRDLRRTLGPLYEALKLMFGEIDSMGVGKSPDSPEPNSRVAAIWADWKKKFPGHPAKAIDALLLHGSMTQGQLRIHVGCATGTISNVVSSLNKAGLINKNGGRISLKEL